MPGPRVIEQDNYEVALKLARDKWRTQDPESQAHRCGASFRREESQAGLIFFGAECVVTHPDGIVRSQGDATQPTTWEQILILHYVTSDGPVSESEKLIAYSEIPDGKFYDAAYQKRTRNYLIGVFGKRPEAFEKAGIALGAEPVAMGDIAFRITCFPRVRLHLVMWRGDDEFPPDASILLEERISSYLDVKDSAVLGGLAVNRFAKV